jgi:hypothetical protein
VHADSGSLGASFASSFRPLISPTAGQQEVGVTIDTAVKLFMATESRASPRRHL